VAQSPPADSSIAAFWPPFDELQLADEHRIQPPALLHLLGGKPLAPSSAFRLGEVVERTLFRVLSVKLRGSNQPARVGRDALPQERGRPLYNS